MKLDNSDQIVVSGVGPVYPGAVGVQQFRDAIGEPSRAACHLGDEWFDAVRFFGRQGFKYWTAATKYAVAASKLALEHGSFEPKLHDPEQVGVFLGTNFGVYRVLENLDRIVRHTGAQDLSPLDAPNFSVNIPASVVSSRYGFRAFNISFTDAIVSGLQALLFGVNAIRQKRAEVVLAGATEDLPPSLAAEVMGVSAVMGGACMFLLERLNSVRARGGSAYTQVMGGALHFLAPTDAGNLEAEQELTEMIYDDLDTVSFRSHRVHVCSLSSPLELNQVVQRVVREVLKKKGINVEQQKAVEVDGALMSVSPLVHLARIAVLGEEGVIVATSPHGHIAILVVKKPSYS